MRRGNRPSLWPKAQALPGFYLSGGITILWISLIVLLPLAALVLRPWQEGVSAMSHVLSDTRMYAALRVSFGCALIAVIIDMVIGLLLVWTLIRLTPPGARAINLLIDLPFAIPTAVTGITLATLYGQNGWIGSVFYKLGIKIAFTPGGIIAALVFVGLPFVVRTVEPVLRSFPKDIEEAAQVWLLRAVSVNTVPSSSLRVISLTIVRWHPYSSSCDCRNSITRQQRRSLSSCWRYLSFASPVSVS